MYIFFINNICNRYYFKGPQHTFFKHRLKMQINASKPNVLNHPYMP